ncbi:condensin complex subunit 1-like [Bolinopsis microptera]|uniref:condensin complex subunit 1-like n=1 Tax=Bolinopsis microptera TaxID=2820187 RepID=UPI003078CF56
MDISTISWKFVFPDTRDDLLVSETGRMSVSKVVPVHNISTNLESARESVKKRSRWGWWSIQHFDTFFSVILKFSSLDNSLKEEAWRTAVLGVEQHTETLARIFSNERLDSQDKLAHLNALQMEVYILVELYQCFEEEGKSSHQIVTTKKGKGKKNREDIGTCWGSGERQEGLHALRQLLDLNLALLWDPPVVHETFVEQVASCCYKLLENSEVLKCKKTLEFIFHVLGILIKRYNHCLGACMKIVQLLQQHDTLSTPFASLMLVCVRDYDVKTVVAQVIREIAQIEPGELARDTNATRNYCNFMLEVGATCGPVVLSAISSLMPHLDGDSYTMRNCVLTIIGDLIGGVLSGEANEEKDTRETLFDRLELHIHDQNAFVRSKSIQILTKLIEQRCVPIPRQQDLVEKVVGSIQDKSSNVRKNALVFINTYLGCNPYSDKLSLDNLMEKLKVEVEKLKVLKEELPQQSTSTQESEESEPSAQTDEAMETDLDPETAKKLETIQKQDLIVQYLRDCVLFTEQMHRVIVLVSQLLASKSASDILESIDFLISAFEFGLKAAELGVRKMLVLVFNPDRNVKDAVVNAYIRLYIKPVSGKKPGPEAVAKNLMNMTYGSTIGELMSLKELVKLLIEKEHVSPRAIKVLLDLLVDKTEGVQPHELNAATMILSMVASVDHTLVTQNMNLLITAGFTGDIELAKNTCVLLQQGVPAKKQDAQDFTRLEETHRLVSTISDKLLQTFDTPAVDWIGFSNEAVKALFCLCELPDSIITEILNKLLLKTFPAKGGDLLDNMEDDTPAFNPLAGLHMYRLLSLLGQTALSTLVHLDTRVLNELKHRSTVRQQIEESRREKKLNNRGNKTLNDSAVDAAEDELGLQGATADDAEAEHVRQVLEREIVTGPGYLARFTPLLKHICSSPQLYPCLRIQNAAVLALCKFMLVSSALCEDNIQLLFTLLEKSSDEKTRCNIMILLHDLIIRFPNLLVNWTGKIYARLSDVSVKVRSTTIRVLTNLILNDMVKVKGNISELAGCLEDEDPKIRSLTKMFFTELSKKSNAIYNVMADIISHLSDPETGRSKDQFQSIMKYLFEFIDKDKQAESLVEKLCHRFRATRCDRQWHDLSFCLSLLSYSEKSLKKLLDNIACYHDKLSDSEVYGNFTVIVEKARKNVKSEDLLNDFETKLRFCHDKGGGDGSAGTDEILSQMKEMIIKPPPPPTKQTRSRAKKKKESSSEGEEDVEPVNRTKRPPTRGISKRKPPPSSEESDDDLELPNIHNSAESTGDDSEDFEVSIKGSGRAGRKKAPAPAKSKSKPVTSGRRTRRSR